MPGNNWLHRWTPDEDAIALDANLTITQVAERLGRTPAAVHGRRQRLRGTATPYSQGASARVAPGRREWLIAKTCFGCGLLLPAEAYHPRPERQGSWSVKCRDCHDREARAALDERQRQSQAGATAKGQPWTVDEIMTALQDRPISELADELGRTYASVVRVRWTARKRNRPTRSPAELPNG